MLQSFTTTVISFILEFSVDNNVTSKDVIVGADWSVNSLNLRYVEPVRHIQSGPATTRTRDLCPQTWH